VIERPFARGTVRERQRHERRVVGPHTAGVEAERAVVAL
jgi:hypothetical protein